MADRRRTALSPRLPEKALSSSEPPGLGSPRSWTLPADRRQLAFIVLVFIVGVLAVTVAGFATAQNAQNVLNQSAVLAVLSVGMAVVLITGGIDLSLPSNMALAAVLGTMLMRGGGDPFTAGLVMVATGAAVGALNGFAVGYLRMIPFVVTLATMTMVSGTVVWVTQSVSVSGVSPDLISLMAMRLGPVQMSVLVAFALVMLAAWALARTVPGRSVYALGTSERASTAAGIDTPRVLLGSYVVAGAIAGISAVLVTARLGSASANIGNDGVVLDVVSAAVVGGVSIYGGVGRVQGAALGAIFITAISNAMNLIGIDHSTTLIIKGVVIIAFVALDSAGRRA